MRLLFAIKTLIKPGGGSERVLAEVSGALARRGHEVTVTSFDPRGSEPFYAFDPLVCRAPLAIGDVLRPTGPGEAVRRVTAMRRQAKQLRPDVAVGFMHSLYVPMGLALLGTGIPVIASEHIAYDHYRTRPLQSALLHLTPLLACVITVLSAPVRDGFPRPLRRRMTVVPDPVRIPAGARADVEGDERPFKTLLAVGRLEPQKDHRTLIDAFGRIARDFPDWRLRIVGEGVLRPELEAQIRALGLDDRIALPGATRDIGAEYSAAQLFAMPSAYESFGLTSAEALGHGLPVVGFADCSGTNELVRDGVNGLLAAGSDRAAALAQALARAMASPQLRQRLGAAAPGTIEPFGVERIADIWEDLLRRTAGKRPERT